MVLHLDEHQKESNEYLRRGKSRHYVFSKQYPLAAKVENYIETVRAGYIQEHENHFTVSYVFVWSRLGQNVKYKCMHRMCMEVYAALYVMYGWEYHIYIN